jgi:hypothetical protein
MKSKRLSTGRQLSKIMASELLEILDIGSLINDQSCERSSHTYSPSKHGWKSGNM